MTTYEFDLLVIGGGSGGVRAARMAAARGARVALVEAAALGGTCVNVGCIPKKLYSYAAHFATDFEDAVGFGWDVGSARHDWSRLKTNRAKEIARLNSVYEQLLVSAGVRILRGWASLGEDGHTVHVRTAGATQHPTAKFILVATGGTPSMPDVPGSELAVTSDSMFDLEPFPRRLAVIGGGYIASEFASIFNGLGAQVTQVHRRNAILAGFDDDLRAFVAAEMVKKGVVFRFDTHLQRLERTAEGLRIAFEDGDALEADAVLFATGRTPNVAGLGLEAAGVRQTATGAIEVDAQLRTSVASIYAIGDVVARLQLTPVALAEGMCVVDHLFGDGKRRMDYDLVPTAVFTHPNLAAVGLSERSARVRFADVHIFRSEFKALKHTLGGSSERTLLKLVVDAATDRVVGVHMVGPDAGEVVQGFAVALKAGATKAMFDGTIGIHPTVAEEFVTMREPVPPAAAS